MTSHEPLRDATRLRLPEHVLTRTVGDETVILDLGKEEYFGVEGVGARFLELVVAAKTYGESLATLLDEYEVEADVLRRDLDLLVSELVERQLVEVDAT